MNRRSFLSGLTAVLAAFALPFRMFAGNPISEGIDVLLPMLVDHDRMVATLSADDVRKLCDVAREQGVRRIICFDANDPDAREEAIAIAKGNP